jgi:hypothetical protein
VIPGTAPSVPLPGWDPSMLLYQRFWGEWSREAEIRGAANVEESAMTGGAEIGTVIRRK